MTGFEPRISGVGSDHFTNCATTTAHSGFTLTKDFWQKSLHHMSTILVQCSLAIKYVSHMFYEHAMPHICAQLSKKYHAVRLKSSKNC